MPKGKGIPVKMPEDVLRGVYANQMMVQHTRDEFILDFANIVPPAGVVNARVIVSPGHMKRMVRALQQNLARYEAAHGPILEAQVPEHETLKN